MTTDPCASYGCIEESLPESIFCAKCFAKRGVDKPRSSQKHWTKRGQKILATRNSERIEFANMKEAVEALGLPEVRSHKAATSGELVDGWKLEWVVAEVAK